MQQHSTDSSHDVRANLAELMYAGKPAKCHKIINNHMSGKLRTIGKSNVVAYLAIMRYMHISHDPVVITHARHANILHCADVEST